MRRDTSRPWMAKAEPVLVVVATPLLLFPRSFLPWAGLGLILLGWLLRGFAAGRWFVRTPLDRPIAILFLMTLVSLYPSTDLTFSMPKFYGILLGLFVYYAVVSNVSSQRRFWLGVGLLIAGIAAISLLGLVGTEWIVSKYPVLQRLYSPIPRLVGEIQTSVGPAAGFHPNELGGTLAFLLPLPLALMAGAPLSAPQRLALGTTILLGLGVLALTASRSALLGLAVALLALLIWRWRRVGFILLVVAMSALGVVLSLDQTVITDFLLRVEAGSVAPGMGTLPHRLELWSRAGYMIADFPFTGIGLNTFPIVLDTLYPPILMTTELRVPHAHNIYLQTAIDLGLGGFLGFLGLWACIAYGGWRAYRQTGAKGPVRELVSGVGSGIRPTQAAIAGMLVGLLSYLVFGLTDAITLGAKPTVFLWLMMGLIVAAQRLDPQAPRVDVAGGINTVQLFPPTIVGLPPFLGYLAPAARRFAPLLLDAARYVYWIISYSLVGLGYLVIALRILGSTP